MPDISKYEVKKEWLFEFTFCLICVNLNQIYTPIFVFFQGFLCIILTIWDPGNLWLTEGIDYQLSAPRNPGNSFSFCAIPRFPFINLTSDYEYISWLFRTANNKRSTVQLSGFSRLCLQLFVYFLFVWHEFLRSREQIWAQLILCCQLELVCRIQFKMLHLFQVFLIVFQMFGAARDHEFL